MGFDPVSYLMGKAAGGGVGGMTPLQYIASTGAGEYIDTGYIVTSQTSLVMQAEIDSTNPAWSSPFGVMEGGGVKECIFYAKNNGDTKCFFCWGTASTSYNFSSYYGLPIIIKSSPGKGAVVATGASNVITATYTSGSASSDYSLFLFTTNSLGSAITDTHICKMKLYGFYIYEGATLTRMYRPALDAVGVPGLYEFATDTFFYNQGAGGFVYPT